MAVRELASAAKKVYGNAVALRAVSQREVNDLLSRKSSWSSPDVMRYVSPSRRRKRWTHEEIVVVDLRNWFSKIMRMRELKVWQRKRWIKGRMR